MESCFSLVNLKKVTLFNGFYSVFIVKTKYGEHFKGIGTSDEDSSTSEEEDEEGNVRSKNIV